tara:strand:+ start:13798 stop:14319 length:522 start_codon:yes stop_codon:yes gene_type:complete
LTANKVRKSKRPVAIVDADQFKQMMRSTDIISVLVIDDLARVRPIAEALVKDGYPVLEVTLRTECALEAIAEMRKVAGAIVGAGTVTNPDQLDAAIDAGAEFIVSPGLTDIFGKAAIAADIPFLPGIAIAGAIMRALDLGLTHFKFFPATASGGIPALESALCVGGSWISLPG